MLLCVSSNFMQTESSVFASSCECCLKSKCGKNKKKQKTFSEDLILIGLTYVNVFLHVIVVVPV